MITLRPSRSAFALVALGLAALSHSQVIWNETVNGDLSGNQAVPTSLNLNAGSNELIGVTGPSDIDYLHFHLAPGMSLTQIVLTAYVSDDSRAFIGVQAGTTFTEPPIDADPSHLLGYTLFGGDHLGTDLLPAISTGSGSMGFTPPLSGSDYTFWIQQTGDPTTYTLNFVTAVPEPATISIGVGLAGLLLRRRRSK